MSSAGRAVTLCIINPWSDSGIEYPHPVQVSTSSRMPQRDFRVMATDSDTINNGEMVTKRLVPTVLNTRLLLWAPLGYPKKTCRDTSPCLSSFFQLPTQSSLLETLFIYGYYFQLKWIKQNESKIIQRININIIKLSFFSNNCFFISQTEYRHLLLDQNRT